MITEEQEKILEQFDTHQLTTYLRNNRNTAFILWQTDDVIMTAEEYGFEMSEEEAADIISRMDNGADCEYGLTWETVRYLVNEWISDNSFEVKIFQIDTGEELVVKFCGLHTNENIEDYWNDDEYYMYGYTYEEVKEKIGQTIDSDKILEVL